MSSIFISHAAADRKLATLLVDFLKEAIGVPVGAIFCSSIADNGVPLGADFNDYIKQQIEAPKLTLLLMTPAYLESAFCMMELGAAWSRNHPALAIVVPPVGFDMVTKTLGLKQAWNIQDKKGLIGLRDLAAEAVPLEPRGKHAWDDKRLEWNSDLKRLLKTLAPATSVDAETHRQVEERVAAQEEEINELEAQADRQRTLIAALEAAKDRKEVAAIKHAHGDDGDVEEAFEELIDAVKEALPDDTAHIVLRHLIMDHFGKAGTIDWMHNRDEFEAAVQRNLLDGDDGCGGRWGGKKLKPLAKALDAVNVFLLSEEGGAFAALQPDYVPLEADDIDFWRHFLKI